jgi:hypothetical protein
MVVAFVFGEAVEQFAARGPDRFDRALGRCVQRAFEIALSKNRHEKGRLPSLRGLRKSQQTIGDLAQIQRRVPFPKNCPRRFLSPIPGVAGFRRRKDSPSTTLSDTSDAWCSKFQALRDRSIRCWLAAANATDFVGDRGQINASRSLDDRRTVTCRANS